MTQHRDAICIIYTHTRARAHVHCATIICIPLVARVARKRRKRRPSDSRFRRWADGRGKAYARRYCANESVGGRRGAKVYRKRTTNGQTVVLVSHPAAVYSWTTLYTAGWRFRGARPCHTEDCSSFVNHFSSRRVQLRTLLNESFNTTDLRAEFGPLRSDAIAWGFFFRLI